MNINATLLVQMLVFSAFIVFTVRFIWPPLMQALETRRKNIADGLAAAKQGHDLLEQAKIKQAETMADAKARAEHIIEQAHQRAHHIIEEAKLEGVKRVERLTEMAHIELEKERHRIKEHAMRDVNHLIIAGVEKVLKTANDPLSNLLREQE